MKQKGSEISRKYFCEMQNFHKCDNFKKCDNFTKCENFANIFCEMLNFCENHELYKGFPVVIT